MTLMAEATYNILARPLTPYGTGGLGWSWVDNNIATEPPTVGCWWVPWYGYVCEGYENTKSLDGQRRLQHALGRAWQCQGHAEFRRVPAAGRLEVLIEPDTPPMPRSARSMVGT